MTIVRKTPVNLKHLNFTKPQHELSFPNAPLT